MPRKKFKLSHTEISNIVADRGADYGEPHINHGRTARLWQAYLINRGGDPLSAEDVCFLNILQKVGRLQEGKRHIDSAKDIVGYVANLLAIWEKRAEQDEGASGATPPPPKP